VGKKLAGEAARKEDAVARNRKKKEEIGGMKK